MYGILFIQNKLISQEMASDSRSADINRTIAASQATSSYIGTNILSSAHQDTQQTLYSYLPSLPAPKYNPHLIHQAKIKIFFFEFLAMFIFFYGVTCAHFRGDQIQPYLDVQVVTALTIGVAISARISGSNVNPSISLCHVFRRDHKYTPQLYAIFFFAQIFGGFLTLMIAQWLNGVTFEPLVPVEGQKNFFGGLRIVLSQMMGTALLVFFVLQLTNPQIKIVKNSAQKNGKILQNPHHKHTEIVPYIQHPFFALIYVTIFVYLGIKYAPMQGSINPAINLCTAIMGDIRNGKVQGLYFCWIWILGDLLGVFVAIWGYEKLYEPNVHGSLKQKVKQLIRQQQCSWQQNQADSLAKEQMDHLQQDIRKGDNKFQEERQK